MLTWLVAGIIVYVVYLFTPLLILIGRVGFMAPLGARDSLPEPTVLQGRAQRAAQNFQETIAVFLALAVLALTLPDVNMALASTGAMLCVLARIVFLPLYLMGVSIIRTLVWIVYVTGLGLMLIALV